MAVATLQRTLALLRTSVRGQLLVLGTSALAAGALLAGASGPYAPLMAVLLVLCSIGLSARSATRGIAGYDTTLSDLPDDLMHVVPRLVVQCSQILVLPIAAWWLALQLTSMAPLAGLVVMFLLVPASLLVPAPLLLAVAAVASGDRSFGASIAARLATRRPGAFGVHVVVLGGLVVASITALPVALIALLQATQLGLLAPVAFGLAAVMGTPLLGCGSVALWQILDADALVRDRLAASGEDAGAHAPGDTSGWDEGAAWDMAIDAGAAWGTWVRMPAASSVALRVTWHGGPPPVLALAVGDVWSQPCEVPASGAPLAFDLPAGDSYLQLTSRAEVPQAISATLLVPGQAAA
jgi:hypothetical protein